MVSAAELSPYKSAFSVLRFVQLKIMTVGIVKSISISRLSSNIVYTVKLKQEPIVAKVFFFFCIQDCTAQNNDTVGIVKKSISISRLSSNIVYTVKNLLKSGSIVAGFFPLYSGFLEHSLIIMTLLG